eukprot:scaffold12252_cov133-Skeletonema_dohrnii-CCMP3373.AAC.6
MGKIKNGSSSQRRGKSGAQRCFGGPHATTQCKKAKIHQDLARSASICWCLASSAQFHQEVLARWLRGVPRNDIIKHIIAEGCIHGATPWGNSPGVTRESLNQKW